MQLNISQKNKKLLLTLIAIAAFLAIVQILNLLNKPPQVISTTPANNARPVAVNQNVEILFNKIIDLSKLQVLSSPQENFITSFQNNTLTLMHEKSFHVNAKYQIRIIYNDELLSEFSFTTQQLQSSPRQIQEIREQTLADFPLADSTPFITDNYRIVYSASHVLEIEILSGSYSKERAEQGARNWVESLGIDPDSHTYTFKEQVTTRSTRTVGN